MGMPEGLLIVISAPSGGGKGTILKELFAQDANLRLSVSATTRQPRPGEENGKQYYFISHEEFQDLIKTGKMLEYTEYCGNFYGTPKAPVEEWTQKGFDVVLEIEVDGGAQIKKLMPDCVSVSNTFMDGGKMKTETRLGFHFTTVHEGVGKKAEKPRHRG